MVKYNLGIIAFFFSEKADIVPGYDFLVNSVWPEIVRGLEEKLPSLFNPGNPDVFHEVISFFPFLISVTDMRIERVMFSSFFPPAAFVSKFMLLHGLEDEVI